MTEPEHIKKSEKFWNKISKLFANSNRTMGSPALQIIRDETNNYFRHTDRILDIGCGPGDITFEMARKAKKVYAIDISDGMIQTAKQKAAEKNADNIEFLKADLINTDFPTESFDVITAFNMLHYVTEKEHLYDKIYKLLKPQGLFISSTACLGERKSTTRFTLKVLTVLKMVPEIKFYKISELENEIKKSGFAIIKATNVAKLPERFIYAKKQ